MGRKDTKAVKSINRMYEQMNLDSSEILHKTKLLLGVYRDVVWATLYEADVEAGHGLIKMGSSLVPFANKFPKNTKLYKPMTTRLGESS